jgi:putative PIN family toxin of toxin-antitoxin system
MIRAALDLNVLVSALLSPRASPARILDLWRDEAFIAVTSEALLATLEQVLSRPAFARRYGLTPESTAALLQGLRRFALVTPGVRRVADVAPDAEDDAVLACALEGNADYLVTGDNGLLSLDTYEGVQIVTPAAFVKELARGATPRER